MADRSVAVKLSADASRFVSEVRRAETSLRSLATAGVDVRTRIGEISTSAAGLAHHFSSSLAPIHALVAALHGVQLPAGGLGPGAAAMANQIHSLQQQLAALRAAAGHPLPIPPVPVPGPTPSGSGSRASSASAGASLTSLARQAAGYLAVGAAVKSTIDQTAAFETTINTFGAVTKTSGDQLKQVSDKALQLGADVTISGASASDAAVAMTELAKGGLSVQASMEAAKGTLQLAAAGGVDAAKAADIETSALASFGLGAKDAAKVADTLANTANAARGNITDFAEGLKYAGATAHLVGWNLTDTSAVLALFAKNGLTGSVGGSTLNQMLLNMVHASKPATEAMKTLGITLYDSNGKFISATALTGDLQAAQKKLSPEMFNGAIAALGGSRAVRGLADAAKEGVPGLNAMYGAINTGAGAAAFSAAKMQGLGGAFANLQNQVETAEVTVGEKFSAGLQTLVNSVAGAIPKVTQWFLGLGPLFQKVGDFFRPIIDGAKSMFSSLSSNGTFSAIKTEIEGVLSALKPIGSIIGGVVTLFGKLSGPVDTAVISLGAMALLNGPLSRVFASVSVGMTGMVASLTRGVAANGAIGAAAAGLSRVGTAAGKVGTFLGGPWGLAVAGAAGALIPLISGLFKESTAQKAAENASSNHADAVRTLSEALKESNGVLDENVRKAALAAIQNAKWGDSSTNLESYVKTLGSASVGLGTLIDAELTVPGASQSVEAAYQQQAASLKAVIAAHTKFAQAGRFSTTTIDQQGKAAQAQLKILDEQHGAFQGLVGDYNDAAATAKAETAAVQTNTAATKAAAQGLQVLSGGYDDTVRHMTAAQIAMLGWQDQGKQSNRVLQDQLAKLPTLTDYLAKQGVVAHIGGDSWNFLGDRAGNALDKIKEGPHLTAALAAALGSAAGSSKQFATDLANLPSQLKVGLRVSVDKTGAETFSTTWSEALSKFQTNAQSAQTAGDLFFFTLQKISGHNLSAAQQVQATADAINAVGQALTTAQSAAADLAEKQAALKTLQGNLGKKDDQGNPLATAQQVAAAERDVAAAQITASTATKTATDTMKGNSVVAQQAQQQIASLIATDTQAAIAKGDYSGAVKIATKDMTDQRAAYIASYIAGAQSSMTDAQKAASLKTVSAEAGTAADKLGLIPKNVKTIIDANPDALVAKAAQAKKPAEEATKKKTAILDADKTLADHKIKELNDQTLPKKSVSVDAATDEAQTELSAFIDQTPPAIHVPIVADTATFSLSTLQSQVPTIAVPIAARAAGRATGGMFYGAGTGTSDSNLIRISNGEGVNTASAMAKPANVRAMNFMNSGGTIPGFAVGGLVGKIANLIPGYATGGLALPSKNLLAGFGAPDLGPFASNVAQALSMFSDAVASLQQAASDAKDKQSSSFSAMNDAKSARTDTAATQKQKVSDAAKRTTEAQKKLDDAEKAHYKTQAARTKAIQADQAALAKATTAQDRAEQAQTKANAAAAKKVTDTTRQYNADKSAAAAARQRADQEVRLQKAAQKTYQTQQAYAARLDTITSKLATADQNLADLKSSRADKISSISGTVSGFDSGILGHTDTRTNIGTLTQGLQYNLKQEQTFATNLAKAKKLGLRSDLLDQIGSAGVDQGGSVAAILAGSSKGQIATINSLQHQMGVAGTKAGTTVGDSMYGAGISVAQGLVKGLQSQKSGLEKTMKDLAKSMSDSFKDALKIKSPSRLFEGHGLNIGAGLTRGIIGSYGPVNAAVAGMVSMPNVPHIPGQMIRSSAPAIHHHTYIQVAPGDPLAAAVGQMIEVSHQVHDQKLTKALAVAGSQS